MRNKKITIKGKKITITTNNKMRAFGTQDPKTGKIVINKKLSKTRNIDGSKKKNKYPGVLDSLQHELLHARHPKLTEGQTYKKTKKMIKKMGRKMKKKLYSMLPK